MATAFEEHALHRGPDQTVQLGCGALQKVHRRLQNVPTCSETDFLRLFGSLAQRHLLRQQLLRSQGRTHHTAKLQTLCGQQLHIGGQNGPSEGLHVLLDELQQNIPGFGQAAGEHDHIGVHHAGEIDAQHSQVASSLFQDLDRSFVTPSKASQHIFASIAGINRSDTRVAGHIRLRQTLGGVVRRRISFHAAHLATGALATVRTSCHNHVAGFDKTIRTLVQLLVQNETAADAGTQRQ
mmetsp:Transcript_39009/g.67519  ORF Transcript_39009/g.67519 Transcript_39009/m.67519 type:complete len:238 (-) Transcript_39009:458-1171(-)